MDIRKATSEKIRIYKCISSMNGVWKYKSMKGGQYDASMTPACCQYDIIYASIETELLK